MKGITNINFYQQIVCHNPEGRGGNIYIYIYIYICNINVSFVDVAKIQSGRGSDKNVTTKGYKGKASSGSKQ